MFSSVCRLSKAADMDHHWVAKAWLSDVGLPQYSQAFHTHLIDGRMLNSLTRRDLERHLNVTKKFHQVSLLLGIELLHMLNFDKEVSDNTYTCTAYTPSLNTVHVVCTLFIQVKIEPFSSIKSVH